VVVQGNSGTYIFRNARGIDVPAIENSLLTGSLETIQTSSVLAEAPEGSIVMTLNKGSNGYIGFYRYTGKQLSANKAYMVYTEGSQSANTLQLIFDDDEATGISIVNGNEKTARQWYTIEGVRLNGKPAKSGVYICNGKAVVIDK
jgi:hypothetical protein